MTDKPVSVVLFSTNKPKADTVVKQLSGVMPHIKIIPVSNKKAMQDKAVQACQLFIASVDHKGLEPFELITHLDASLILTMIAWSEKDYDVVNGMELGYSDVVSHGNFEHLVWVLRRELSHLELLNNHTETKATVYSDFTGVHSRLEFLECIKAVADKLHQDCSAIVYLQLDNFSWINENLGMLAGDHYLKDIGHALKNVLHKDDIVARYQGGNFVIFVAAKDQRSLSSKADMIRETVLELTTEYEDNVISSTASLGVRLFDTNESVQDLISNAYDASDVAKTSGGDAVHYYRMEEDESSDSRNKRAWNERILEAFDKDLFVLYFQPIVNIQSDNNPRYEVLLRMVDDQDELISPGTFLPYAERAGLMADIDRKVIAHTLEKAVEHRTETGEEPEFFVKLSGKSVDDATMAAWIAKAFKEYDYPAEKFVFEITESIAMHHLVQTRNLCSKLTEIKAKIALDHFGTRFRSFKLLESINIHYLKIDGSIIQHLALNKGHQAIVQKIVNQAKKDEIRLIASSVQEAASLPLIWQFEIPYVQGFFLGVPTEALDYDFENMLL